MCSKFYKEQQDHSKVKSTIVAKYFKPWANILKKYSKQLMYLDLFSGPGRYQDGSESTPLLVVQQAINMPELYEKFHIVFNDKSKQSINALKNEISKLSDIGKLKPPLFLNKDIVDLQEINIGDFSTLSFIDPWGYKGVSAELVRNLTKGFGCDCILFFNLISIKRAIRNQIAEHRINILLGKERADKLRAIEGPILADLIVQEFSNRLKEFNIKYVIVFTLERRRPTEYKIIFASKNKSADKIMRDIMADESSDVEQGVASFKFKSKKDTKNSEKYPMLALERPLLDELGSNLLKYFCTQIIEFDKVIEEFNTVTDMIYTNKNYNDILQKLEKADKVTVVDPRGKRAPKAGTIPDHAIIEFF